MEKRSHSVLLVAFFHLIIKPVHSQEVFPSTFTLGTSCNFQGKLDHGCVELAYHLPVNMADCARFCSARDTCEGFSLDVIGKCYLHFYCIGQSHLYTNCSSPDAHIRYYSRKAASPKSCINNGVWKTSGQTCQCVDGFLGYRCERYAESCNDIAESGQYAARDRRSFYIKPTQSMSPFHIVCSFLHNVVQTHILRYTKSISPGGVTFNHTWNEYVNGFLNIIKADLSASWVGLEVVHYLTTVKKMHKLVISVHNHDLDFQLWQTYFGTIVGNASTNYELSYDSVTINHGNAINGSTVAPCLSPGSPIPFSTPDVDNDLDPNVHCAKEAGIGWWFSECSPRPSCNPSGFPYLTTTENETSSKIHFQGIDMRALADHFKFVRIFFED